jgi:hypothetical protein
MNAMFLWCICAYVCIYTAKLPVNLCIAIVCVCMYVYWLYHQAMLIAHLVQFLCMDSYVYIHIIHIHMHILAIPSAYAYCLPGAVSMYGFMCWTKRCVMC